MKIQTKLKPLGVCTVRAMHKGEPVDDVTDLLSNESKRWLEKRDTKPLCSLPQKNLVVNKGRGLLARILGGVSDAEVDRLVLGDLGGAAKVDHLPNLSDEGVVSLLTDINGNAKGPITLDKIDDKHFPDPAPRYPSDDLAAWASTCTVAIDGVTEKTTLTDAASDFSALGIKKTDQVTLNTDSLNPLVMGIKKIVSTTELELHNPRGYETEAASPVQYRVDQPGTQMIVSRIVHGNDFPVGDWGPLTLVQEAGLLFSNDDLFNRIVCAPTEENAGFILQPDSVSGQELSLRFEWVITF
jgi:hypothetical protein